MIKIFTFLKVLLVISLVLVTGFLLSNISFVNAEENLAVEGEIVSSAPVSPPVSSSDNCPPGCHWGCYENGDCCPQPDPGEPQCNEEY